MSPVVMVGQKLTDSNQHAIQAYLYMSRLQHISNEVALPIPCKLSQHSNDASSISDQVINSDEDVLSRGITSISGSITIGVAKPSVTSVLASCDFVGLLGAGLTGRVEEYIYDGKPVAVKVGHPFNPGRDKEDAFKHVGNEIEIYDRLTDLQGQVVPRVMASGFENWFTTGGMILITEKVGKTLVKKKDGLFVDGTKLCTEDVAEIRRKALEALDAILACDVAHMDAKFSNLRVEKINGEFHLWWIDFGLAEETDCADDKELERRDCILMFAPYI